MDSRAGQIFEKYETDGYEPRQIVEHGLMALDGIEPQPVYEMNAAAFNELQKMIDKLAEVAKSIKANGGKMTDQHQEQIENALDPKFVTGMQRVVRPGFTKKPGE